MIVLYSNQKIELQTKAQLAAESCFTVLGSDFRDTILKSWFGDLLTVQSLFPEWILNSYENDTTNSVTVIPIIKNSINNIYLTGIGKCGHICKKSVSTWQSLGISCNYLYIPDLFHGDFGILKNGDIIIYISNSGNTDEIINCSKYIKNNFKITQIGFTINTNCIIKNIDL
jgi:hypothetical protein